jgi:methyl coenzyme M reductase subunit C
MLLHCHSFLLAVCAEVLLQAKHIVRQVHILVLLICCRPLNRARFASHGVIIDLLEPTAFRSL